MADTKRVILEEAVKLFARDGYEAVSVEMIAEAVGIKAPSLYKHYKSKRDIFDHILREMERSLPEYGRRRTACVLQTAVPVLDTGQFCVAFPKDADAGTIPQSGNERSVSSVSWRRTAGIRAGSCGVQGKGADAVWTDVPAVQHCGRGRGQRKNGSLAGQASGELEIGKLLKRRRPYGR